MKKGYFVTVEYGHDTPTHAGSKVITKAFEIIVVDSVEQLKDAIIAFFQPLTPANVTGFAITDVRPL